jgi:hypothetical protein
MSLLYLFLVACSLEPQLLLEESETSLPNPEVVLKSDLSGSSAGIPDQQYVFKENDVQTPLYTITSVPSLDDTQALVDYFFNGDTSFWFESPEDMTAENIAALVDYFLYDYGLPTTTL